MAGAAFLAAGLRVAVFFAGAFLAGAVFLAAAAFIRRWVVLSNPFTALTDLRNMAFSSASSWISTIFSTPLAPITVGTPTYMPLTPYSPDR